MGIIAVQEADVQNVLKFPVAAVTELPPILLTAHAALAAAIDGGPPVTVEETAQHAIATCATVITDVAMAGLSLENARIMRNQVTQLSELVDFYTRLVE